MPIIPLLITLILVMMPEKELDTFKDVPYMLAVDSCYFMDIPDYYENSPVIKICDWR